MPSLDEIKKRAKNPDGKPDLSVDRQGNVQIDGDGTKVPKGTFHILLQDSRS